MNALSNALKFYLKYLVWLLALLLAVRFFIVLRDFNTVITDNDQVLFWLATDDLSHGIFHTPFTYGCGYGSILEALLAVPFYLVGIPLYYALPVSNAWWTWLLLLVIGRKLNQRFPERQAGTVFLFLMVCLPTEFYALLFAAKAMLGGIIMLLLALAIVIRYESGFALIMAGLCAGLGLQFNPNALFLLFPLGFFIPDKRKMLFLAAGVVLSLPYVFVSGYYFRLQDSEFLHKQWKIQYSIEDLKMHLQHMDSYLNTMSPVFHNKGYLAMVVPFLLAMVLLVKKKWIPGLALLALPLALFLSFGINKISDGADDVLFAINRFYLAVAFSTAFCFALLFSLIKTRYALILPCVAPVLCWFFIRPTAAQAETLAQDAGSKTYSVKKTEINDLNKHHQWTLNKIRELKKERRFILVSDANFYTENMYLSTKHLPDVMSCYDGYRAFYWLDSAFHKDRREADIMFVIKYDKSLERKSAQYPQYFHGDTLNPYFLVRGVKQPMNFIDSFLK